ncbi:hypothetical protein EOM60_06040 [Candidatus Saccharibacteria bacterium]|nr:hypothetical protein [Candidatus Saccharibacteria bacterium]
MSKKNKIIIAVATTIVIVAGIYLYRLIYPPVVATPDPRIETIKQEVIKDRIIIKEVIRDAKEQAVAAVEALSDDAVADELNSRLNEYRKRRGQVTQ